MRGFTLFTGGGGVDIAMQSLGVDVVGGIEYDDKIAQVARDNGMNVTTADILECDPRDFPAMDWLHASPPCPNFSVAKAGAQETENDLALANKIIEFIMANLPPVFTLENVYAYRKSKSWQRIENALHAAGYWIHLAHVNFADYGVPQTRKRMIVRAKLGGMIPWLVPTHHKQGFNCKPKWIGWYEAIEDLIPTLPDSKFAPWQMKRLPDEFRESLFVDGCINGGELYTKTPADPILTIKATTGEKGRMPRAFVMAQGSRNGKIPTYSGDEPHGTVTANSNQTGIKAFVMDEGNTGSNGKRKHRDSDEPIKTVTAGGMVTRAFIVNESSTMEIRGEGVPAASQVAGPRNANQKAFIINGTPNDYGKSVTIKKQDEPVFTQTSTAEKRPQRAHVNGRVVKMTVHALARFQTFPDSYIGATTRIIGNAVPPIGFANVMRNLI